MTNRRWSPGLLWCGEFRLGRCWGDVMAKYDPLLCYLKQQASSSLTLSFGEIEAILGAKLPQSARTTKQWWWSDPMPRSSNVQCRAWIGSGYVAELANVGAEQVTFRRGRPVAKWRHTGMKPPGLSH